MSYDVIVIGGGIAGMAAARRAQQLGARVIVVDKAPERSEEAVDPGSNTRISGGLYHAAYRDPRKHGPDELYANLLRKTDGTARPDVARAWADNALRALDFLISEGAQVAPYLPYADTELGNNAIQPGMKPFYPLEWQDRGPDRLLSTMEAAFGRNGGIYRHATKAVELVMENGAATGVVVEGTDGARETVTGTAIVMADGGFHANRELVAKYVQDAFAYIGTAYDTGDCLRMALDVGAETINMASIYGHLCVRDERATREQRLRYPGVLPVANASIVVGADGRRVGDETVGVPEGVEPIAAAIARSATPRGCWVIFDDALWRGLCATGPNPVNPMLLERAGPYVSAGSIAELAKVAGLPADALTQTVDAFNRFCTDGTPLDPQRTERVSPLTTAPFHAIPVMTQVTFTMGGVLVNGRAEVLDKAGSPIPGLHAAGGTMGGLQGGPRHGYSGGWSQAATFGLIAGETVARDTRAGAVGGAVPASR